MLRGLRREATLTAEGSSHAVRVSGWGLIGKRLGMFIERRQQLGEPDLEELEWRRIVICELQMPPEAGNDRPETEFDISGCVPPI